MRNLAKDLSELSERFPELAVFGSAGKRIAGLPVGGVGEIDALLKLGNVRSVEKRLQKRYGFRVMSVEPMGSNAGYRLRGSVSIQGRTILMNLLAVYLKPRDHLMKVVFSSTTEADHVFVQQGQVLSAADGKTLREQHEARKTRYVPHCKRPSPLFQSPEGERARMKKLFEKGWFVQGIPKNLLSSEENAF